MSKLTLSNFWQFAAFSFVLAMLSFPVIARVWFDYLHGGHGWRQGDWLINLGSGFVRRGAMGEAFIMLSDFTGVPLLIFVQVFQLLLFVALVFVVWILWLAHKDKHLLLFLAASPAFFLFFGASDVQGIMRKELFGFLALSLLTVSGVIASRSAFYPILALLLYTLGCVGNIMHSLMLPAIIAAYYLLRENGQISTRAFQTYTLIAVLMSTLWMGLAIMFREVSELAGMCDPLLARGFDESFCDEALRWLVTGEVNHIGEVTQRMTTANLAEYALVATLSLVPVALSFFVFVERGLLARLLIITFVPILPLYFIATDWGRWISIPYTTYVFLLVLAHSVGKLTIVRQVPISVVYVLLAASVLISPEVSIGWQPGGAVRSLISSVADFF